MRFLSTSPALFALALSLSTAVYAVPYSSQDDYQPITRDLILHRSRARISTRENLPPWLGPEYSDPQMLTPQDKRVFSSELKDLKLGSRLKIPKEMAKENRGIWTVKDLKGYNGPADGLLAKIMADDLEGLRPDEALNANYGEVKVLKLIGDLVSVGFIEDPDRGVGSKLKGKVKSIVKSNAQKDGKSMARVVVMKKKKGMELFNLDVHFKATEQEQRQLEAEVKALTCKEVARIAVQNLVYHGDLHLGNILVTMSGKKVVSIELIDWGMARSVRKDHMPTLDDAYNYCFAQTEFRYASPQREVTPERRR
ncbi:hypothetical protein GYMLUDRAFT_77627 [Collybiopsis luxurians FD-317 M1]|uniref:ABC1 atypical kinase-like domain-containing protein n=1 Tax=Collybiopsis luxurians FD-317 M1 TaxID=944289 RepID=A0A0D0ARI4_9AGAR|nr:hypothetical protein GYMLUDRAFT_77627 [Collybiopsis luxurians FD-317 M1]